MVFRLITIKKIDNTLIEFYPENIQSITFEPNIITLHYWEENKSLSPTTKIILKKEDYNYPNWQGFIEQLNRIFDIKEI